MTGAGAAEVAFVKADGFLSIPGSPTYYEPFKDPAITELSLDRAVERLRKPTEVFATESVAQNIEGAFSIEGTMDSNRQTDVHDIVFTDPGSNPVLSSGQAPLSRFYVAQDYLASGSTSTAERVLKGVAPLDYEVSYSEGGQIRVSMTCVYADEESNTSVTPSTVSAADGDAAVHHGADFTFDSTTQSKEQSLTFSVSNISRLQRGSSETAVDAIVAAPEASVTLDTIITEKDQLELAYGGSGQSSTSTSMDAVSGSISLSAAGSPVTTYNLSGLKPTTHSWTDVISADADTTETVEFIAADSQAVDIA